MFDVSIEEIQKVTQKLASDKRAWHFHLLTPDCLLNSKSRFALVVENTTQNQAYIHFSEEKPMETSKMFLELLHGKDVLGKKKEEKGHMSEAVMHMIKRAKELNGHGFLWHHHVLFPACVYNKHQGKWTIIFEDTEERTVLESVSEVEPSADIQTIESAFYAQTV